MGKGTRFALALTLFWFGFLCLYIAFHPGGILLPGPRKTADGSVDNLGTVTKDGNQFHQAGNIAEVIEGILNPLAQAKKPPNMAVIPDTRPPPNPQGQPN